MVSSSRDERGATCRADRGAVCRDDRGAACAPRRSPPSDRKPPLDAQTLALRGLIDGIWEWSTGDDFVWASEQFAELLGYPCEPFRVPFAIWTESLHPAESEGLVAALAELAAHGTPLDVTCRMRLRSGSFRAFRMRARALRGDGEKTVRAVGSLRELSPASDEAGRDDGAVRVLLDHSIDAVVTLDPQGRIDGFNRIAVKLFGYSQPEAIGQEAWALLASNAVRLPSGQLQPTLSPSTPSATSWELLGSRRDGTTFPMELRTANLQVGGRAVTALFFRDISERRAIERSNATQHAVTRRLSEAHVIGDAGAELVREICLGLELDAGVLWLSEPSAQGLHAAGSWHRSRPGCRMFELATLSARKPCAPALLERLHASDEPVAMASLEAEEGYPRGAVAASEGLRSGVLCPIRVNGATVGILELVSRGPRDASATCVATIAAIANQIGQFITRRHVEELGKAKEAAEASNQAKTVLLANVSHELRTPLNAIVGMADLLWESTLDGEQRHHVSIFRRAGANLLALVNDLLDLSRMEAGKIVLAQTSFDTWDVLCQAMEAVAVRAYQKGLEVIGRIHPDVPARLVGDPTRLRQILVNLLGNAVKFTEQGEISITIAVDEAAGPGAITVSVQDTGIGIPADKLEVVFERFSQLDTSPGQGQKGTGLGLAICKAFVEAMNGHIRAEAELGVGSTFRFTVPLAADGNAPCPSSASLGQIPPRRVLVMERSPASAALLREILAHGGHEVVCVGSGGAARGAIEAARERGAAFDAVLLDTRMPVVDGFDVVEWARTEREIAARCVLMLGADTPVEEMARVRRSGFPTYLLKPITPRRTASMLAELIRAEADPASVSTPPSTSQGGDRPLQILVAEDHPDNRAVVAAYFKATPHTVVFASDGREAVAVFKARAFDLVLMDVQMPELDGCGATRAIRAWEDDTGRERTPVIALSAFAMREDVEQTVEAGCDGHLSKPVRKQVLMDAVEHHTRGRTSPAGAT